MKRQLQPDSQAYYPDPLMMGTFEWSWVRSRLRALGIRIMPWVALIFSKCSVQLLGINDCEGTAVLQWAVVPSVLRSTLSCTECHAPQDTEVVQCAMQWKTASVSRGAATGSETRSPYRKELPWKTDLEQSVAGFPDEDG